MKYETRPRTPAAPKMASVLDETIKVMAVVDLQSDGILDGIS